MEEQKSLIAVLQGIANSIKKHSGIKEEEYDNNKIAPNDFYERVLSFAEHTFAPSMVDIEGEGFAIVKNLIINGDITIVGNGAFESSKITSVQFKAGVETISPNAFNDCRSLTDIDWGKVSTIEESAFQYCLAIKNLELTQYLTTFTNRSFFGCSGIESITVHEDNPNYKAEGHCLISKRDLTINNKTLAENTLIQGCKKTIIPDYIVGIGGNAFGGGLSPSSVDLPAGVTYIGNYAFQNCSSLKTITMGDNVTEIGSAAFIGCGFTEIVLSAKLTTVGYAALSNSNCSVFDFSKCNVNKPPTLGGATFGDKHPDGWKIIIPQGSFEIWSAATNWASYKTYMRYPDDTNPNETN